MIISESLPGLFDVERDAIRDDIVKLGKLVCEQFHIAMNSLNTCNAMLFRQVRDREYQADLLKVEIDHACNIVLGQHQNKATDFKWVLTILKIMIDLEGIGSQAELLVMRAEALIQQGKINQSLCPANITRCANLVFILLNKTIDAFSRSDANLAAKVILQNKQISEEYNFITCSLIDYMLKGPRSISMTLDILLMAKSIERISDHAKSISEYIILTTTGEDVRHSSIDEMENKFIQPLSNSIWEISGRQLAELEEMVQKIKSNILLNNS